MATQVIANFERRTRYRGIEYSLAKIGPDRWSWIFFPKIGDKMPRGGELKGSREHAERACMNAITQWLRPIEAPSNLPVNGWLND